jgi:hypothetical protein
MARYAADTNVSVERSKVEIERILSRWGATSFAYGWQGDRAVIQFTAQDRQVRFELPLPARSERRFTRTPTGKARPDAGVAIMAFEDVFLAWTALPDGLTVGESVRPAIAAAYETGQVAPLLALGPGSDR